MSKICFMNECKDDSQTYFSPCALTKPCTYQTAIKVKRQVVIAPLSPQRYSIPLSVQF